MAMDPLLLDLVGAAALAVTASTVVPQTVRLLRTRDSAGVSPTWTALGAVSAAFWTAYLVQGRLWWPAVADAAAGLSYVLALTVLHRQGVRVRRSLVVGAAWGAAFLGAGAIGGWPAVGALLGVAFAVQVTPSLWTAYRTEQPTGAALATWRLVVAEGVLWGLYGLGVADHAVVAFGVIAVLAGTAMVLRIRSTHRGREPVAVPEDAGRLVRGSDQPT